MYWKTQGSPVSTAGSNSFTVSPPHAARRLRPAAIAVLVVVVGLLLSSPFFLQVQFERNAPVRKFPEWACQHQERQSDLFPSVQPSHRQHSSRSTIDLEPNVRPTMKPKPTIRAYRGWPSRDEHHKHSKMSFAACMVLYCSWESRAFHGLYTGEGIITPRIIPSSKPLLYTLL